MEYRDTAPKRWRFFLAVGADNRFAVVQQGQGTATNLIGEPWQLIDAVVAQALIGGA